MKARSCARSLALAAATALVLAGVGCDRRIEPFDPDERVEAPDLSRIFPEGAERAAQQGAEPPMAGRGAPPPGRPAAGAAGEAAAITGTIRIAEPLAGRVPGNAVLFLIARGTNPGPPVAVVRVPGPSFPLDFEIGPDDRMIEAIPFVGPLRLSARIDADGNAMTRNPGDLQGEADATVDPGASDVPILIDEIL